MFRKSFISFILTGFAIIVCNAAILAQTAPVSGTVELVKADGTREPVAGALIEVYRVDIKAGFPSAKTSKKGEFSFAGLPFVGQFIFAVSAPGCSPTVYPVPKGGGDRVSITLDPGDGRKLTEDEARKMSSTASTKGNSREMTAEEKKKMAEEQAKIDEVKAKNEKVEKTNQIIARTLKEGNEAFNAKNYDLAIAKYEEGIAADPDFVGSAPVLGGNRSAALRSRAVDTYNKSVKLTDVSEKVAGVTKAKQDLTESAKGYMQAWNVLTNAPAADVADKTIFDSVKKGTLSGAIETFKMVVRTEQVDTTTIDAAKVLIPEYLNLEPDAVKKAEASLAFADLYRVVGDSENAIAAYMKILETSPDNLDALAGAGLSLVNLGYLNNDKTKLQEGANVLQKFASLAPDTHKFKADAISTIEFLKKEQKVTPQKAPPTKKKT